MIESAGSDMSNRRGKDCVGKEWEKAVETKSRSYPQMSRSQEELKM
jgi:hypothetical protein